MILLSELLNIVARFSPIATIIGASVAIILLIIKLRQDWKELRRKQAEIARLSFIDLHQDEYSMAAMIMLDYQGWRHTTRDFEKIAIDFDDVETALRVRSEGWRPNKELLVRRSFDTLFGKLENVIVLARKDIRLIRWSDFAALFGYYIHQMRKKRAASIMRSYATQYGFSMIVELIERPDRYPIPTFPDDMTLTPTID